MDNNLYLRQEALNLKTNIKIAIVGCGGVGYWTAKFAAMSGVERITLFDPDTVEDHNRNRLDFPVEANGMNKATLTKRLIESIRPDCFVIANPIPFDETIVDDSYDWVLDCTDRIKVQSEIEDHCNRLGIRYVKVGYDGTHMTIANRVAQWGQDEDDGYNIVPSWVVPSVTVAALVVAKVLNNHNAELSAFVDDLFTR